MGEQTKIGWTDRTFNPVIGCTKVSPGCDHCYAEELMDHRYKRVKWGPHGERQRTKTWGDPLKWNKKADEFEMEHGRRQRVFCASLADVFDNQWPDEWRAEFWDLVRKCDRLDWQLLTKRPQNIRKMLPPDWGNGWKHVWLGTSTENQEEANRRIKLLRAVPAAVHFISAEPLLGGIDLVEAEAVRIHHGGHISDGGGQFDYIETEAVGQISWVIVGGESGKLARPFNIGWARDLVRQCADARIPVFVKQMGSDPISDSGVVRLKHSKGEDPFEWPVDLRVRQFPASKLPVQATTSRPVNRSLEHVNGH